MPEQHYDVIVIGTGPGGASLAQRLAPTGKRILMLERGDYLPRAREQLGPQDRVRRRAPTRRTRPGTAPTARPSIPACTTSSAATPRSTARALFRLRERDFEEVRHADGISPAWPLNYDVFEPYYTQAEQLFHVHGQRGEDPTEPPVERALPVSAGLARAAHPGAERQPRSARACIPSICRSASCSTRRTAGRRRPAPASAATRSTASPA